MSTNTAAKTAWLAPHIANIEACIAKLLAADADRRNYAMFLGLQDAIQQLWRAGGVYGVNALPEEIRGEYLAFHDAQKKEQRRLRRR